MSNATDKLVSVTHLVSGIRVEAFRRVRDNTMGTVIWGAPDKKGMRSIHQIPFAPYEEGRKAHFDVLKRLRDLEDAALQKAKK